MSLLPFENITMPGMLRYRYSIWPLTSRVEIVRRTDDMCLVRLTADNQLGSKGDEIWVPGRSVREPTWREEYLAAGNQKESA